MRRLAVLAFVFSSMTVGTFNSQAFAAEPECHDSQAVGAYYLSHCAQASGMGSHRLLVFFPGIFASQERIFQNYFLMEYLKAQGLEIPNVLTIVSGKNWNGVDTSSWNVLADLPAQNGSLNDLAAYVDNLVQKYKNQFKATEVVLLGESLGGFNGLQIFLRSPNTFDKVALICPALTLANPFSDESWRSDKDYQENTAWNDIAWRAPYRYMLERGFADEANWLSSSPLEYLRHSFHATSDKQQSFFLAWVTDDAYGFRSATPATGELLRQHGATNVQVVSGPGGHCHPDPAKLSAFILK